MDGLQIVWDFSHDDSDIFTLQLDTNAENFTPSADLDKFVLTTENRAENAVQSLPGSDAAARSEQY